MGQYYVLPLCKWHHHWDSPLPAGEAFGRGSKPWEAKHGKQLDLLQKIFDQLGNPLENEDD